MKYLIYGINRVSKDFEYIFRELDIILYAEDDCKFDLYNEKKVLSLEEILKYRDKFEKIIICGFDKFDKETRLISIGLKYQIDYIFAEDLFYLLDGEKHKINPLNKKVAIWGTGNNSIYFSEYFPYFAPEIYIDSFKYGMKFYDMDIKKPDEIEDFNEYFIIVAVAKDEDICEFLEKKGLVYEEGYINSLDIQKRPSEMLRATIYDRHQYKLQCETPLNHIEYLSNEDVYCCCSTFMRSIGSANNNTIMDIWNSISHRIVCLSVLNHTYTFCNKNMCPLLFGIDSNHTMDLMAPYKNMKSNPEVCAVGFDYSCNLKCETCRDSLKFASGDDKEQMICMAEKLEKEILNDTTLLIMAGDGEVFASDAYRHMYRSKEIEKVPYIRLLTNGTLFNENNWNSFSENKTGKIMLTASVDAASKQTYEKIRINGNFDTLKENMKFAGMLRKKGDLAYFRMNFVVQRRNYNEMKDFVKWGMEIGADEVFFTKILNWGTYSDEEFKSISMFETDGVTPKTELKEILDDPIMKEKIVDIGTIKYNHENTQDIYIHNYYMWELERKVPELFE